MNQDLLSFFDKLQCKKIGCLDFGGKKFGTALADQTYSIATPHSIYIRKNTIDDINYMTEFVEKNNIGLLVVGIPTIATGGTPLHVSRIEEFSCSIQKKTQCFIYFQDESFSTRDAVRELRQSGVSRKKTKKIDDMAAAAIILRRTLDQIYSLKQTRSRVQTCNKTMKNVANNLYVGSQRDFFELMNDDNWAFVQAARDPFFLKECSQKHMQSGVEPLFVVKNELIALNLSDSTRESLNESMEMVTMALSFIDENIKFKKNILVHCNHGVSRSPSIALMYLIKYSNMLGSMSPAQIIGWYKEIYPQYSPTKKMASIVEHFISTNKN